MDNFVKSDFIRFYIEHRDRDGFVDMAEVLKEYKIQNQGDYGLKTFVDKNGKVFMKQFYSSRGLDAEVLLSRIYEKMGFQTAKYFPCRQSGNEDLYAITPTVEDKNSILAAYFRGNMFKHNGMVFPRAKEMDEPTGSFTPKAIGDMMRLRLTDTATFNHDRHQLNFYYTTEEQDNKPVVTGIKTFDYANSGQRVLWDNHEGKYFNNFVTGGTTNFLESITRDRMLELYRENETAQEYLPSHEMALWLGSINFNDEARNIKQETGYKVDQGMVDRFARSFDEMAEDLEQ